MSARQAGPSRPTSVSWDAFSPARPFQSLWVSLGLLTALPGVAATLLRLLRPTEDVPALFASFSAYGLLAYLLASVFFLVALVRARQQAVLAVVTALSLSLLACHVYWVAPFFVPDRRPPTTPTFTLLSLNTLQGRADPRQLVSAAERADIVVLLEATDRLITALSSLGWSERFPHAVGAPSQVVGDTVIYSRFPWTDQLQLPESKYRQWVATAQLPDVGPVRVIAAHPCNPFCDRDQFQVEHQQLQAAVRADLDRPLVVAGDLNAVSEHAPILALRSLGLRSATDLVGAGWLPTFPANRFIPPLLPIDHVLVNGYLTATSVARFRVAGSDHLGLVAQLAGAG